MSFSGVHSLSANVNNSHPSGPYGAQIFLWNESPQGNTLIKNAFFKKLDFMKLFLLFPLTGLLTCGLIWLLALNSSKLMSKLLLRDCCKEQADYVLVQGIDQVFHIEKILAPDSKFCQKYFFFRKLPYFTDLKPYLPWVNGWGAIDNRHQLDFQGLPIFLLKAMGTPMFIYQIMACAVNMANGSFMTAGAIFLGSVITLLGTWVIMYYNFLNLKKLSQQKYSIKTTGGDVYNVELRSGDFWIPRKGDIVPADCLVSQGQLFLDEANLTGQSIPVYKKPYSNSLGKNVTDINKVFEGSKVLEVGSNCLCKVIFTGFQTRKGRILRKLLVQSQAIPQFLKQSLIFQFAMFMPFMVGFFATIYRILWKGPWGLFISFFFILNVIVPPYLAIYFNFVFSVSLLKLKLLNVFSTSPSKTLLAGNLKTVCFDKTGTLTTKKLNMEMLLQLKDDKLEEMKELSAELQVAMGTCHSCIVQDGYIGDEIQVEVLKRLKGIFSISSQGQIFKSHSGDLIKIVKRFQFDNSLRRMSVVIQKGERHMVVCKGAPNYMIPLSVSSEKQIASIKQAISLLNSRGLRNIAYFVRQIPQSLLKSEDRQFYQRDFTFLALVGFRHELEPSAVQTVTSLLRAEIKVKVISGDDPIVTAVVSKQIGIIEQRAADNEKIIYEASEIDQIDDQSFERIKVFGRATPTDKAKIITRLQKIAHSRHRSYLQQITTPKEAIAMVGDGANDVLAILQADVGMGLTGFESSYGASFAMQSIEGVLKVVSEGKATVSNLMDATRFFIITNCLNCLIILTFHYYDLQYRDATVVWLSYPNSLMIILTLAFGKGSYPVTKYFVSDKFFTKRNLASIILHFLIGVIGLIVLMYYVGITYGECSECLSKIFYVTALMYYLSVVVFLPIFIVSGQPFKQNFYKNKIYLLCSFAAIAANSVIFFSGPQNFLYYFVFGDIRIDDELRMMLGMVIISRLSLQWFAEKWMWHWLGPSNY